MKQWRARLILTALTALVLTVSAAASGGYCGEEPQSVQWRLTNDATVLTISGSGAMRDWAWTDVPSWQGDRHTITTVIVEEGVTEVGNVAFCNFPKLTWVELPSTLERIGDYAFCINDMLRMVEIPESVKTIGQGAFYGCEELRQIDLPSGLTSLGAEALQDCTKVERLHLPAGLTEIGEGAFGGCMAQITVAPGNTAVRLEEGFLLSGDGKTVLSAAGEGLEVCTVPEGVERIGAWAFHRSAIKELTLPATVRQIGTQAFSFCKGLEEVKIPEGVEEIGESAFVSCTALAAVTLPSTLTGLERAAFSSTALQTVQLPEGITEVKDHLFARCEQLREVILPEGAKKVMSYAFEGCTALEEMHIPEGMELIGVGAFEDCSTLRKLTLPATVQSVSRYAFWNTALEEVTYGGTLRQWEQVKIRENNEPLLAAEVHCRVPQPGETVCVSAAVPEGAEVHMDGGVFPADGGMVSVAEVFPGTYDVTVKKAGCLTHTVKDVKVEESDIDLGEVKLLSGDVNADEKINMQDLRIFLQNFNKQGENIGASLTDVNEDSKVNMQDLRVFLKNFNKTSEKDATFVYGA